MIAELAQDELWLIGFVMDFRLDILVLYDAVRLIILPCFSNALEKHTGKFESFG